VARVFVYDGREFPDPDPTKDVEGIKATMTDFFPELANAETKQTTRGEDTLYEFVKKVGVKG
jgi:PRTRC genetic system protein C